MDPLVGAVCNPPEIWQMVDEMLVAQKQWLPQYRIAIDKAEERLSKGNLITVNEGYRGAARLKTKTVEEMARDREKASKNAGAADKAN
jgi:alpha-galactosidase